MGNVDNNTAYWFANIYMQMIWHSVSDSEDTSEGWREGNSPK